jgi:LacI family transcriptional regulator
MSRKVTRTDVALKAGVSKWTVARAFVPGSSISDKARADVLAAADELGYRPNLLARSLATKTTNQVAVLVDDFANPYKLRAIEALTKALSAEGLSALLVPIDDQTDHADAVLHADQRQVDAIVLLGTAFRNSTLEASRKPGSPPMFVLARESTVDGIPYVSCDAKVAMAEIVAHLVAQGYRKPAFVSGPKTLSTALGRQKHFRQSWAKHGVKDIPEIEVGRYDAQLAADAVRTYLRTRLQQEGTDVLVCENDVLAMGAMDVIRHEFKLKVPKDLAVVGFDGMDMGALASFGLTTYEQPIDAMARRLVEMLLEDEPTRANKLVGQLRVRSSS